MAFDTYYFKNKAKTVCVGFNSWLKEDNLVVLTETIENIPEYVSGEFYKRELPCILSLLNKNALENIELIIVDGFVYLDDNNKYGLGAHLYNALNKEIPIIGVAKRDFATINKNKSKVYRGESQNPLFITSIGIELNIASEKIKKMKGKYRIPTLLKELDKLTREK
ncbi:endonuclease V [Psychroserpens ponticola]|uniref:Endonuclease V n=1 Tax=Psychroserpens ponticola TaxID=2932268 RepID=A0ABY7RX04_9FLAO|nr:endonuclease V [Psychroserpens ponticola]WCO00240.1 endonuclease V [Psychroserpens ponticola]